MICSWELSSSEYLASSLICFWSPLRKSSRSGVRYLRGNDISKQLKVKISEKIYHDAKPLKALGGFEITVKPQEFVCILGPSGCGKTTLLRLVAGLDTDFEGEIKLGDRMVKEPARDCGLVFQEPRLLPWMTVRENIRFGIYENKSNRGEQIKVLLELLDLEHFADSYPNQLSGGMAQRVALARALVNIPDLLLLDEPFGALDELTKRRLQEELQEVLRQERTTVLMVTHDIEEAVYLSDRILIMSKRPGEILDSFAISMPKPRERTENDFLKLNAQILKYMKHKLGLF